MIAPSFNHQRPAMDPVVPPSLASCLEGIGPGSTSPSISSCFHLDSNPFLSPLGRHESEPSLTTSAQSPSWSSSPGRPGLPELKPSEVGPFGQEVDLPASCISDSDEFSSFSNLVSWASAPELLNMAGQWHWDKPYGQPVHPNMWELGHDLPYTTRDANDHVNPPLPTYAARYDSPAAQYPIQAPQYGDSCVNTAPYEQYGASQYRDTHAAPFRVPRGCDNDGLDDFGNHHDHQAFTWWPGSDTEVLDRRVLASNELPAANLGSTRRLTLPVAHPESNRRLSLPRSQPSTKVIPQPARHADTHSASIFAHDHGPPVPGYSLVPPPARQPEMSPPTAIATQVPLHRHRELQRPLQQDTPPLHSAFYTLDAVQGAPHPALPTLRQSSSDGASSPSAVASLRKQSRTQTLPRHQTPPVASPQQELRMLVRASHEPPTAQHGIRLISPRQALPNNHGFHSVFPYELLNAVQSKCFATVYGSTDNLVVSAPTGSGKTVILELAICKIFADRGSENFKVVYQAPTKALCSERARDWEKKFGPMNLRCAELTGDTAQAELRRVGSASIIVTTPEKWDSITRKWEDHRKLLQLVGLLLIDEVHILKDARGATLEAVVSRMKSIGTNVRFVALSATVPNAEDIATWLGLNHTQPHLPARLESFGESFRPVKLDRVVKGYNHQGNEHVFDKFLESQLPPLLADLAKGKPSLVFCFTRKSCEATAKRLAEWWASFEDGKQPWPGPSTAVVVGAELQDLVNSGVAFHHAGLAPEDRKSIERAFIHGNLSVICCTSTLAVGVNLPCHTVVLKGTAAYQDGKLQEISDLEVMQMLGRAGRPQYDSTANALILTLARNVDRYNMMVSGKEVLESTLHLNLIEHLNSEIGLQTITDLESATKWLSGTFLSVRLRQNPNYYKLTDGTSPAQNIDSGLKEICERDISLLQETNLVTPDSGFKQTEYGKCMAKYMVEFHTMKLLLQIPRGVSMEQLLNTISRATEFKDFRFKPAERPIFREVNKSPFILYPIDETVAQTWHKISLLVQLHLGGADYPDTSESQKLRRQLAVEKNIVFEKFRRFVRCVIECKGHDQDSVSLKTALELSRSLAANAWEGHPPQLLQVPNIGAVSMRKLVSVGVRTVKDLATKDYDELERHLSRRPPFGKKLSDTLARFPLLSLDLATGTAPLRSLDEERSVPVKATLRYLNKTGLPKWADTIPTATFVAETTSGLLVFWWRGNLRHIEKDNGRLELLFTAKMEAADEKIHCHFSCDEIVGTIVSKTLSHNLPASIFPLKQRTPELVGLGSSTMGEAGQDELDDEDMLEAAAMADSLHKTANRQGASDKVQPQETSKSDSKGADFPLIDDLKDVVSRPRPSHPTSNSRPTATRATSPMTLTPSKASNGPVATAPTTSAALMISSTPQSNPQIMAKAQDDTKKEPVRLPNGKWQCNHACTGGNLTKVGKLCSHKCCHEGLDRPRKVKPKTAEANSASKKRKPEEHDEDASLGLMNGGPNGFSTSLGLAKKKAKARPESAVDIGMSKTQTQSTGTSIKPAQDPTGRHHAKLDKFDMDMDTVDLVDGFDDDELPDVATLAARLKEKEAARTSQAQVHQRPPQEKAESVNRGAGPAVSPDKALATIETGPVTETTTTDLDEFDDPVDFNDLDAEPAGFDEYFNPSDNGPYPYGEGLKTVPDPETAFRRGAEDAMVSGTGFYTLPRRDNAGAGAGPAQALTSMAYKKALHEAAKLCGIPSSQSSSFFATQDELLEQSQSPLDDGYVMVSEPNVPEQEPSPKPADLQRFHKIVNMSLPSPAKAGPSEAGSSKAEWRSTTAEPAKSEPAWVQEVDQDFVNEYRGFVNFTD